MGVRGREGQRGKDLSSSHRATVLSDQGPALRTSFNLNYLLNVFSPDTVRVGLRTTAEEFGGTQLSP